MLDRELHRQLDKPARHRFQLSLARTEDEVREAQRLRYKVFADEMGASLRVRVPGHDTDMYDPHCEHLIVRELGDGRVVGTYRILAPDVSKRLGGGYADQEFAMTRLANLRPRMVEIGRTCIHRDFRGGGVIALLWSGLAEFMSRRGYDYLMGCASIPMFDGGHNAANLYVDVDEAAMAPIEYRVFPRHRLPFERLANGRPGVLPPLLKGYLRAGAWVCGEPAWDPEFNSADLLLLLPMARINPRYVRHFLKNAA